MPFGITEHYGFAIQQVEVPTDQKFIITKSIRMILLMLLQHWLNPVLLMVEQEYGRSSHLSVQIAEVMYVWYILNRQLLISRNKVHY